VPLIVTPQSLRHKSEFFRELAALLGAGLPLLQSLEHLRARPPQPAWRPALAQTIARIENGETLTAALEQLSTWLVSFDRALIEAGERSGRLVESCRLLADHYDERVRLARTLLSQVAYPVALAHLAVLIFPTSFLVGLVWRGDTTAFLLQKLGVLLPLYGLVFLLLLAFQGKRAEAWRSLMERITDWVPLLGTARREQALARLAAALEALISAGVTIIEAWDLAADASGSPALRRAVRAWKPCVEACELPSDQVSQSSAFPALFANLYHTGETSGQLDQELRHLHTYYQEAATNRLRLFVRGSAMALYLAVLVVVGYQIVSFWLGYFGERLNILNDPALQ
jgi:type II secretory pathway component PulF